MGAGLHTRFGTRRGEGVGTAGLVLKVPEGLEVLRHIGIVDVAHGGLHLIGADGLVPDLQVVERTVDAVAAKSGSAHGNHLSVGDVVDVGLITGIGGAPVCALRAVPATYPLLHAVHVESSLESAILVVVEGEGEVGPGAHGNLGLVVLIAQLVVAGGICTTESERGHSASGVDGGPYPSPVGLGPLVGLVDHADKLRLAVGKLVDLEPEGNGEALLAHEVEVGTLGAKALLLQVDAL